MMTVGEREILAAQRGRKGDTIFLARSGGLDERSRRLVIFPTSGLIPEVGKKYLVEVTGYLIRARQCRVLMTEEEYLRQQKEEKEARAAKARADLADRVARNQARAAELRETPEYEALRARVEAARGEASSYVLTLLAKPHMANSPADFNISLDTSWPE
jgi:hypothetical protein